MGERMIGPHAAHPLLGLILYGLFAFVVIGAAIHAMSHQRFIDRILQRPRQAKDNERVVIRPTEWLAKAVSFVFDNQRLWNWLAVAFVIWFVAVLVYDGIQCRCFW
jgi:hypothetical protein